MDAKKHYGYVFEGLRLFICGIAMLVADVAVLSWKGLSAACSKVGKEKKDVRGEAVDAEIVG